MKLPIYDRKGEVVKTYEKDVSDLLFCTVDDVSQALDLKPGEKISTDDLSPVVTEFINNDMEKAKAIVKDIFDGLTDEELKMTKIAEFDAVIVEAIGYTIGVLGKGKGNNEKN